MKEGIRVQNRKTKTLTEAAAMIALSALLSLINFTPLPWGGGITPASMLPIVVFSYRHGIRAGTGAGLVLGFLNLLLGFHTVAAMFLPGENQLILPYAIFSLLLDYLLAYTAVGLGGIFRKRFRPSGAIALGAVFALFLRYLLHIVSGFVIYGAYAEWFFSQAGRFGETVLSRFSGFGLSLIYSVVYNGSYMIPEIILTAILGFALGKIRPVVQQKSESVR